jgi:hypothetical protein
MKLKRLDESNIGRRRLSGRTERRGSQMGLPTWGAFLFGGVFVAVGTAIFLAGIGVIAIKSSDVHAPFWILSVFGCVFGIAGLLIWAMGWKQFRCRRRRTQAMRSHPGEPAYGDYEWDPREFQCSRWSRAVYAIGGSAFLTMFLSAFNFWAFRTDSPWMVKAITIVFDLILILAWWEAFIRLGRAIKFGGSKIIFRQFPIRMAGHLVLTWQPAKGIVQTSKGSFTLRCVEEWFESTGSGKNQSTRMIHEEVWRQTWLLDESRLFRSGEEIALEFDLPSGLPTTQLSADRPVFWELEVKLDLPGLDFEETYLIPVY